MVYWMRNLSQQEKSWTIYYSFKNAWLFSVLTLPTSHYAVNNWIHYPPLTLVHPIDCQHIYSLESSPIDLGEVKKISINRNGMFYVLLTLWTLGCNHQGTGYRRKEEEKNRSGSPRGLKAASAPWDEEIKINPLYYWSMWMPWNSGTWINTLHLQQKKRKKSIFIVYLSSSSEKYLCEPLGWKCRFHRTWLFQCIPLKRVLPQIVLSKKQCVFHAFWVTHFWHTVGWIK